MVKTKKMAKTKKKEKLRAYHQELVGAVGVWNSLVVRLLAEGVFTQLVAPHPCCTCAKEELRYLPLPRHFIVLKLSALSLMFPVEVYVQCCVQGVGICDRF